MSSPKTEVLLKTCCSTTGEGPHWDDKSQSLYFVDTDAGGIHRWDSATNTESKIKLDADGSVGFVVPRDKGGLVVGLNKTISVVDWDTKETETLVEVEHGMDTRFNDGKCDSRGRLWAGTMAEIYEADLSSFKLHQGSLYSLSTDLALAKHASDIYISNGLAWSEDNSVMYYIDSIPKKVCAYDFNDQDGTIANMRVVFDYTKTNTPGYPDGMCIDVEGKLWVACYNGSSVIRIDPQTGTLLQTVDLPAPDITSVCFGGKNMDELFVTSFANGKTPLCGSLFRVTDLGVKGTESRNFKG